MPKIIAQSFAWNVAQFITAPIVAVHKYVDEIQVFDGAYQFMGDAGYAKVPWSTDGTEDVLKALAPHLSCAFRWIPTKEFYANEAAKKTFMQRREFWKPGEWKYLLSDDEIPAGRNMAADFKEVKNSEDALAAWLRLYEPFFDKEMNCKLKYSGWKCRFIKWQPGLHFRGRHDRQYNREGLHTNDWRPRLVLRSTCILNLRFLRPFERLKPMLDYERLGL